MKARILFLAAVFSAITFVRAEDFNFERAKEIFAKKQRGETLSDDEQKYMEEAKRRFQERTGMSEEQINKLRALHEKEQRGESLSAEEKKMLEEARSRAGAMKRLDGAPSPQKDDAFDWQKARSIHEKAQRGESLTADEQKYYDEAKERMKSGRGPSRPPGGGDSAEMQRAREIYQKKQNGGTLTAEEEKILAEAMKRRGGGGGGGSASRNENGPSGQPVADAALLKTLVPLPELTGSYKGQDGGLYGGGKNEPPAELQARASKAVTQIKGLDRDGKASADGRIVLLSIGMSNTTMEFSGFVQKANADERKAANVVVVDGAQGGKDATAWATADAQPWSVAEDRLKVAGVTPQQVQAVWIKQALIQPQREFPAEVDRLHDRLDEIVKIAKTKYPNLRLVFLSSRTYAGYATTRLNPEPHAYEGAFAVRRLISGQSKDETAPVLLWGPYIWAAGEKPNRADGFTYTSQDVGGDGTHPSQSGRDKVASALLSFFTSDLNAKPWFTKH